MLRKDSALSAELVFVFGPELGFLRYAIVRAGAHPDQSSEDSS
jgi:hypothetical protein